MTMNAQVAHRQAPCLSSLPLLRRLRQTSPECRDDALVRLAIGSAPERAALCAALDDAEEVSCFMALAEADPDPRPWPDLDRFR